MNAVFDWCVGFLEWLAWLLGMSYKEINVRLLAVDVEVAHRLDKEVVRRTY